MSKLYTFQTKQFIPATIDEVWDFISSPKNLKRITPPYMGFDIVSESPVDTMYTGIIVAYKVSPMFGLKMNWVTEITHIEDKHYFIDEQRFGPYTFWHHKHFIKAVAGGVEMTDILHYKVPFGWIGDIVNFLFIRSKLQEIFNFRFKKVEEIFGKG